MSVRLELDDLPPRYREQALKQIADRERRRAKRVEPVAKVQMTGILPQNAPKSEQDYYLTVILPKIQSGEVVKVLPRETFLLLPRRVFCGIKLPAAHYTPDFLLEHRDGKIEAVEVKSKFTRAAQRDYIYRRRLFIDLIAEPRGWTFTEHITEE